MKYSSLTIHHFRGIESLTLSDLGQVNLLVGRNNCGKTSVLEALFLLSGMSNPRLPITVNNLRDLILQSDEDFRTLFHGMDIDNPVAFESEGENARKLEIRPIYDMSEIRQDPSQLVAHEKPVQLSAFSTSASPRTVEGIRLDFSRNGKVYPASMGSLRGNLARDSIEYVEEVPCQLLNSSTFKASLGKALETILVQKRLPELLDILRAVEPRCQDLRMGANESIFVDIGAERLLPINILGDGFRRLLTLLVTMNQLKGGILLIDEIEIGLHYTTLVPLWKLIFTACKQSDIQVFATTHSYECVEAFSKIQVEMNDDASKLFRIQKKDGQHKAFGTDIQALEAGIESGLEVR